jgi:two-component system, NtrC family, sensor histidine kinase HydH
MTVSLFNWEFEVRVRPLLAGLLIIFAVNALAAFTLNRFLSDRAIQREGEVAADFLNSIASSNGGAQQLFALPAPSPELVSFFDRVANLPDVIRTNIYSLDGFTRYSTEQNLIGLKFHDNAELERAASGEIIIEFKSATDDNKPEHLALRRLSTAQLVEAYIPVKDAKGAVVAVVEFYKKPDALQDFIASVAARVWLSAAVSSVAMLLALAGLTPGLFFYRQSKL